MAPISLIRLFGVGAVVLLSATLSTANNDGGITHKSNKARVLREDPAYEDEEDGPFDDESSLDDGPLDKTPRMNGPLDDGPVDDSPVGEDEAPLADQKPLGSEKKIESLKTAKKEKNNRAGSFDNAGIKNILTPPSTMTPKFDPEVHRYKVVLEGDVDSYSVNPLLDYSKYRDSPRPRVFVDDNEVVVGSPSNFNVPEDRKTKRVIVKSCNPDAEKECSRYDVEFDFSHLNMKPALKSLAVTDSNRDSVPVPTVLGSKLVYEAVIPFTATNEVEVVVTCRDSDEVLVDGKKVRNGSKTKVTKDDKRHTHVVPIKCVKKGKGGNELSTTYTLKLERSDEEVQAPDMVVQETGFRCEFDREAKEYFCGKYPKGKAGQFIGRGMNDQIRYLVESGDKSEARLLNGRPSTDVLYDKSEMKLVGRAGDKQEEWKIKWELPPAGGKGLPVVPKKEEPVEEKPVVDESPREEEEPKDKKAEILRKLGEILATILMINISSVLSVLGLSNTFGVGAPFGAAEVATTFMFLLQYFCFTDILKGENSTLGEVARSLQWVTLFVPLPWHSKNDGGMTEGVVRKLKEMVEGDAPRSFNEHLAKLKIPSDVTNLDCAKGCLFWSVVIFDCLLVLHLLVIAKFRLCERRNTFPHRVMLGNWESVWLHFFIFPVVTAATIVIRQGEKDDIWVAFAWSQLSFFAAYLVLVLFLVSRAVKSGRVTWVWNTSTREQGSIADDTGFWVDETCDQLNTEPANRSACKWLFPWKWVSTVADIEPVEIGNGDDGQGLLRFEESRHSIPGQDIPYAMGKSPRCVEVVNTRSPAMCCPGQRLTAGLLRTQWLDVVMTYQGITRFMNSSSDDMVVPLTVKTCQLTGPIAGGRLCFFFDGARIPFVRVLEGVLKYAFGVLIGVAMTSKSPKTVGVSYVVVGVLAAAALFYSMATSPRTRKVENGLLYLTLSSVAFTAITIAVKELASSEKSEHMASLDSLLWFTYLACWLLAAYSVVITTSVFIAVIAPPLDETRLLEKLSNCQVTLADHDEKWAVNMPAYTKFGCNDYLATISDVGNFSIERTGNEPDLEFTVEDFDRACRSGSLRTPIACVYATSLDDPLGYRHVNIYDRTVNATLSTFLKDDPATDYYASYVASCVAQKVEINSKQVAVVTIDAENQAPTRRKANSDYDRAPTNPRGY